MSPGGIPLLSREQAPSSTMRLAWLVPLPVEGFAHSLQMFLATRNAFSELTFFLWFSGT